MKIDKHPAIPQIIFNETLAINHSQFLILAELNLIEKIASKQICCHFRFFDEKVVYPKINKNLFSSVKSANENFNNFNFNNNFINFESSKDCIYCLSNKKQLIRVKFFCDFRNSYDEETNKILEFCETNAIIINIYDCENLNSFNNFTCQSDMNKEAFMLEFYRKSAKTFEEKLLLIDDQEIKVERFFDNIGLLLSNYNNSKYDEAALRECFICKRKILNLDNLNILNNQRQSTEKNVTSLKAANISKCHICSESLRNKHFTSLALNDDNNKKNRITFKDESLKNFKNKLSNQEKNKNHYNFIAKLKINEFYFENPEKSFLEREEKSLEFSAENIKPVNYEVEVGSYNNEEENTESLNAKSIENDFSFLDF